MEDILNDITTLDEDIQIEPQSEKIIKVMGVGGGGCNAINYMYSQGIQDVSFLVCNTDNVALSKSSVPAKLQLGPGLGAGGRPELAAQYAEESRDRIKEALNDGTKMLFLTAGMGGGTGTGASSIVAEVAQELGILTVGIVTIPFKFEGKIKIRKAMTGVARLNKHVDALLVINNEKLKQIYPDLDFLNAFSKSDDVVCNAARSIAEIITVPGYINTDFSDVYNTLKNGHMAIMNVGKAKGEERIKKAIADALNSPLINTNDVHGAKRILMQFYFSREDAIRMQEIDQINEFVEEVGSEVEVQWGATIDDTLEDEVRVTLLATGYEVSDLPYINEVEGETNEGPTIDEAINDYYKEQTEKQSKEEPKTEIEQEEPKTEIEQEDLPREDEQCTEIDLTESVQIPAAEAEIEEIKPEPAVDQTESGELILHLDEDDMSNAAPIPTPQPKKAEEQRSPFARRPWLRGRRG
ncbi:MAG: cell division protein FtsZ [Paludibacteraceae bacterium]|nr:cell division protein FtsZ [Paludibacteraceae bacterium]